MTSLYIYLFILTISMLIGVWYGRYQTGPFKWLLVLIVITWIAEFGGFYYLIKKQNNNWIFHLLQPVEYSLLALFSHTYFKNKALKKTILLSILLFAVFCLVNVLYIQKINAINSYSFSTEAVLLVVWSVVFFYRLYNQETIVGLSQLPEFWVFTGILFFYAGSFSLMSAMSYLTRTDMATADSLYTINRVLNCLLYSLYAVGFVCKAIQMKLS